MKTSVRTTIIFALSSGLLSFPAAQLLGTYWYWSPAAKLVLWANFVFYSVLLVRWSGVRLFSILFPAGLLLGAALWPGVHTGFYMLALGFLCWVRSGICYSGWPLRRLAAELVTVGGGIFLVNLLISNSTGAWSLGLCLFLLVQSLYFFMIPGEESNKPGIAAGDPFVRASQAAEKVMDGLR
jgi:hypothetical protein